MSGKTINVFIYTILIVSLFSCKKSPSNNGNAYFKYVKYDGNDTYYNAKPLKDGHIYNPVLPGFYPDPSVCHKGDDYYLVNSTFSFFPGVPIFHSKNLTNWKQIGNILERPSQFNNISNSVSEGIYAPAISYNPHNDTFYMVTTFVAGGNNFFVTAKDPAGPWSDPIWLKEVPGIDPSFFFDQNGKSYICNNQEPEGEPLYEGHKSIWIQEFDTQNDCVTGPRKMIRNGGHKLEEQPIWIEGPHIYKKNDYYYLMSAEGGTSINHSVVIFRSKDIWGPYETNPDNPILTQRDLNPDRNYPITNAGHADLFQSKDGNWYVTFLACRPYDNKNSYNIGRETFILPVNWEGDWPIILNKNQEIPMQIETIGENEKNIATNGNFKWEEHFVDNKLGLNWIFLRTPHHKWYSFPENKDGILLELSHVNLREKKQPSFLACRQQHHNMTFETGLNFIPNDSSELAGIALFQNEAYHLIIGITKIEGDYYVVVQKAEEKEKIERTVSSNEDSGVIQKVIIAKTKLSSDFDGNLALKVCMKDGHFSFEYKTQESWNIISNHIKASYLSTNEAGGFIGTVIGLYGSTNE